WAQERFLLANETFYNLLRKAADWLPIDFSGVPSERLEDAYNRYHRGPKGQFRLNLRFQNPDLEQFLIDRGEVTTRVTKDQTGKVTTTDTRRERAVRGGERISKKLKELLK
ncbi:hypothetical protein LCGC14_3140070, partial [marine sediment metagenome]